MTNIFYDQDADIKALEGKTVVVIGYGNQGRSQALNLRDSGVKVIVGNIDDHYRPIAGSRRSSAATSGPTSSPPSPSVSLRATTSISASSIAPRAWTSSWSLPR